MFYPEDFANFALEKSFVPKVPFSVNTSPIMDLLKLL